MASLSTIDDVIAELDRIIETTIGESSPLGIFAYVYRRTTAQVAEGIGDRRFEDNARMERFDVSFAQKYITPFWDFREGKQVSSAWAKAFQAVSPGPPSGLSIIQHLTLGMNAHINLDFGIAAAEIAATEPISALEKDFLAINLLLEGLIDELQERISRVSPLMFVLDLLGQRNDEKIVNWSIIKARHFAWNFACRLADAPDRGQLALINEPIVISLKLPNAWQLRWDFCCKMRCGLFVCSRNKISARSSKRWNDNFLSLIVNCFCWIY